MKKLKLHELNRPSLADYQAQKKRPIFLILDNIRSAHNVGSIFRTADGFGIEKIILTGITARPPHREITKTAIGATESVEWEYFESPLEAVKMVHSKGYSIYPIEQTDAGIPLRDLISRSTQHPEPGTRQQRLAFIFGNEVDGISDEVIAMFDQSIEIPQLGTKHSFNVAVSVGIVLWEVCRNPK